MMKAAVVTAPYTVEVQQVPEPMIAKDTEIKIKVTAGAICNMTDNVVFTSREPEKHWPYRPFPYIIGHECSGYLVEKGAAIQDLEIGDRIVYWTVEGQAFADYLVIDTARLVDDVQHKAVGKINAQVPNDIAAILEMVIGSSRYFFSTDGEPYIKPGDTVAVIGLGPAGLIYLRTTRLMGASKVVGIDMTDFRLQKAKELGADQTFKASAPGYPDRVVEALGGTPDVIVDATGADVVKTIIALGKPGARVIPFGVPPFNWNDRAGEVADAGLAMSFPGLKSAQHALPYCTQWANEGLLGLEPLITHHLPLDQVGYGLDLCREHADQTLKVVIGINV